VGSSVERPSVAPVRAPAHALSLPAHVDLLRRLRGRVIGARRDRLLSSLDAERTANAGSDAWASSYAGERDADTGSAVSSSHSADCGADAGRGGDGGVTRQWLRWTSSALGVAGRDRDYRWR